MTIILLIIISFIAFFFGYILGAGNLATKPKTIKLSRSGMNEKEKREYENFLNYDGSEQS